jgi:hypothetical protein
MGLGTRKALAIFGGQRNQDAERDMEWSERSLYQFDSFHLGSERLSIQSGQLYLATDLNTDGRVGFPILVGGQ